MFLDLDVILITIEIAGVFLMAFSRPSYRIHFVMPCKMFDLQHAGHTWSK
jgi:hypothetical protein